jgi:hypothetical protein
MKEQSAAILTIKAPGKMSKRGRKKIAEWLIRNARDFLSLGDKYTDGRFTARYIYR